MLNIIILIVLSVLFFLPSALLAKKRKIKTAIILAATGLFTLFTINEWADIYLNVLWFKELGYESRFWTVLMTRVGLFFTGFLVTALIGTASMTLWYKWGQKSAPDMTGHPMHKWMFLAGIAMHTAYAFIIGLSLSLHWDKTLLFINATPFAKTDPVFLKDIGFYVFTLPFLDILVTIVKTIATTNIIAVAILYALEQVVFKSYPVRILQRRPSMEFFIDGLRDPNMFVHRLSTHVSLTFILLTAAIMFDTFIARFELLYSHRGVVFGAGWTDLHVQLPAYNIALAAMTLCIVAFSIATFSKSTFRTITVYASGLVLLIGINMVGVKIIPAVAQHYKVSPNELPLEKPYLMRNIDFTREAYNLKDTVTEMEYPVNTTAGGLSAKDQTIIDGIRLWDPNIMKSVNNQNQAFRLYYNFNDVDVDRYLFEGKLAQVMLSLRELNFERLMKQSQTWQNLRLVYTHGYGSVVAPVNRFSHEGLPDYYLKDIPPKPRYPQLEIKQPRIYYGTETLNPVYVNTKIKEFDYPIGDVNAEYTYTGAGGIRMDSFIKKLALALDFEGIRMFTTQELTPESKVLLKRDVASRVRAIAPFLMFDKDLYHVIADGKIYFMWDAYTTSGKYPYSQPVKNGKLNYIRNSVKIVIDAYNGTVDFYIAGSGDPIVQAYSKAFPGMFKPFSAMPKELQQHVRYPEDLLSIQSQIYAVYHMSDPGVFYNREDAWEISKVATKAEEAHRIDPYYLIAQLPDANKEEFVLALPFSPYSTDKGTARNNMSSLLIARCDQDKYGKLTLFKFPKDRLVYGPLQIGIRINQDETISKDLTLWNQQGSQVIFGNLLVIPLSQYRLMYVQPVYLQAAVGKMPEMKRVVVVLGEQLAYGTSFEDALGKILSGKEYTRVETKTASVQQDSKELARTAAKLYDTYRTLMGQGKYSEAGKALEDLGKTLNRLK